MARWLRPCSLLLLPFMLVATAVADDEKCTACTYPSPPPPSLPPPVYYPPPPVVYPPPVYYPPPPVVYPPPPYGGGGGYEPTPGYNPTPSGWFTPPNMPSYLTPPGMLYPQDPGFRPNAAAGFGVPWRAAIFMAAGVLAL